MINEESCNENQVQISKPLRTNRKWVVKIKLIATSVDLLVRLTSSFISAAYGGWLSRQRRLVRKLRGLSIVPSVYILFSKFSLITIQHRSKRFSLIYEAITSYRHKNNWFYRKAVVENIREQQSVHVDVLYDPGPNRVQADVIFIHGIHGSLYNTWKQGLWAHRKQVQNLPLEHNCDVQEKVESEVSEIRLEKIKDKGCRKRYSIGNCGTDYNNLLANITNLLNDIDDTIKDSKPNLTDTNEPYSPCWPRDWLPKDCPGVRVIAVNYTTDPFLWRPVLIPKRVRSSLPQRSQEMEDHLLEVDVGKNPIVWVGHSKGGLYVKQILVDALQSGDPHLSEFLNQTKGIMFYSVPHRGSSLAHWNLPLLRQSIEITEVKKDCQEVLNLHENFLKLFTEKYLRAEVFSFVETVLTSMFMTNLRVVSVDSADLGLGAFRGVNIDHREICKPLNRNCFLYKELTNLINRVIEKLQ